MTIILQLGRVDDGAWEQASLTDAISIDTWRQWAYEWETPAGNHTVALRAIGTTRAPPCVGMDE